MGIQIMSGDTTGMRPPMVQHLAGQFDDQSGDLSQQVSTFADTAAQIGEAFGLLGACDGATDQYTNLTSDTVDGLNNLVESLTGISSFMKQNADAMQGADQQISTTVTDAGNGNYQVNI